MSKLKNIDIYKDRYTTEIGTDVNKTYMHMSEDINLLL